MLKNLLDACGAALAFFAVGYAFAFGGQDHVMIQSGKAKFLHENICQENRIRSHPNVSTEKNVRLCQDTGWVPRISTARVHLPIQYLMHSDGYVIARHRSWSMVDVKGKLEKGIYEMLGMATYGGGDNHRPVVHYLLQSFLILTPKTCKKGYQYVSLYDQSASSYVSCEHIGMLALATFRGNRPFGNWVVNHQIDTKNNEIDCIEWVSSADNNRADRQVNPPNTSKYYIIKKAVINKAIVDDLDVLWYPHPVLDVEANEEGTHLRNTRNGKLLSIRHIVFQMSNWVDVRVCVGGKDHLLNRLNLECFLGRVLERWEVSDHVNRDRTKNSLLNLRACSRLFNANNRSMHCNNTTGVSGVSFNKTTKAYVATVRMYTVENPTISKQVHKAFLVSTHGKESALNQAIAYRNLHALRTRYDDSTERAAIVTPETKDDSAKRTAVDNKTQSAKPNEAVPAAASEVSAERQAILAKHNGLRQQCLACLEKLVNNAGDGLEKENFQLPAPTPLAKDGEVSPSSAEFPDSAIPSLALVIQGRCVSTVCIRVMFANLLLTFLLIVVLSNLPLSDLVDTALIQIREAFPSVEFHAESVASKIKLLAKRTSYVGTQEKQSVNILEDGNAGRMWRWEIKSLKNLPLKYMTAVKNARAARKTVLSLSNALCVLLTTLCQAKTLLQDPESCQTKCDATLTEVSDAKETFLKFERALIVQETNERKLKTQSTAFKSYFPVLVRNKGVMNSINQI
jgi:hypothetical protein